MSESSYIGKTIYERAVMFDTGPLISLYDDGDSKGIDVQETIIKKKEMKYPFYITWLTIAETHRRILYDVNYITALQFLQNIKKDNINIIEITEPDCEDAIKIIEKYSDISITFTDAITMSIMKRLGIKNVLTFDRTHFTLLNFTTIP